MVCTRYIGNFCRGRKSFCPPFDFHGRGLGWAQIQKMVVSQRSYFVNNEHDDILNVAKIAVDGKSGKVLNCLINASDDIGGRTHAFYDFLERMFGKIGE